MKELDVLRSVYADWLVEGNATVEGIVKLSKETQEEVSEGVRVAVKEGLLQDGEQVKLTDKGRSRLKIVMIGGAFEIIHPGHLHTIEQAGKLGNTLVVVVAADKTVVKNKGREPVTTQEWRVRLVSALRGVDVGIPGGQGSIYDTLQKVRPDVVALGYDQLHNPAEIEAEARRRGIELRVERLTSPLPDVKTSKIVNAL
jgi:cytidyltransferase-like protein